MDYALAHPIAAVLLRSATVTSARSVGALLVKAFVESLTLRVGAASVIAVPRCLCVRKPMTTARMVSKSPL